MSPNLPPDEFLQDAGSELTREDDLRLEPEFEVALADQGRHSGDGVAVSEIAGAEAYGEWLPEAEIIETRGTWTEVWRRFRKDKFAVVGLVVIALLVIVAVGAPWIAPHSPLTQYDSGLTNQGQPVAPGSKFWLGTDLLGRDLLSRLIYGARVSLVIGILANGFALFLGVIFGIVAGFFRGWLETLDHARHRRHAGLPHPAAGDRPVVVDQQAGHLGARRGHRHRLLGADDARHPRRGAVDPREGVRHGGAPDRLHQPAHPDEPHPAPPGGADHRLHEPRHRHHGAARGLAFASSASACSRRRRPGGR